MFATRNPLTSTVFHTALFTKLQYCVVSLNSFSSAKGGFRDFERATLFLFVSFIYLLLMRNPVENRDSANNSTAVSTSISTSTVSPQENKLADLLIDTAKQFDIEKACKNQAYAFILSQGHFESYKEYTRENPSMKWHDNTGVETVKRAIL